MVKFSRRWNGDGFFLQRWNGDGFWKFSPSPLMEWYLLNHWQRWFFNGFSNFEDQWFTMVTRFSQNEILDKMRVNEDLFATKHGMKSTSTQVDINQGTSCSIHCKKIFLIFQKLSLVCLISASARHKGRKFTTIAKNQWFLRWPLPLMEWYLLNHWDQWFSMVFIQSTIGDDVFQWLPTIGPTMRW